MSRTDAHQPYWMLAQLWEPFHWHCEYANLGCRRWGRAPVDRECDLPESPQLPRDRPRHSSWRQGHCIWIYDWYSIPGYAKRRGSRVRKWFKDHVWTNAERVRMRDECIQMRKEFNSWGEVVHEPQSWHHRHGGQWMWD